MKTLGTNGSSHHLYEFVAIFIMFFALTLTNGDFRESSDEPSGDSPEPETAQAALDYAGPQVFIEVNIPATQMTVYENGIPIFVKPVAVGSGVYPTPTMESSIKRIEWNPSWYPPPSPWAKGAKPAPPGPNNPLGVAKMPISDAILFHGTNKESTVGHAASHGCMRMLNKDVAEIAWYLQSHFSAKSDPSFRDQYKKMRGTTFVVNLAKQIPVRLVYEPIAVKEGSVFFFPDHYKKINNSKKAIVLNEMMENGIAIEKIDDLKIEDVLRRSPTSKSVEVPIESLLL